MPKYIKEIDRLYEFILQAPTLKDSTIQNIDFRNIDIDWNGLEISNAMFLGCKFKNGDAFDLIKKGAHIMNAPDDLPYQPFRSKLYTWQELHRGDDSDRTTDLNIYNHFSSSRHNPNINEALWQRIHDHAIDDALRDLLLPGDSGLTQRPTIGMMGGHASLRTDPFYLKAALTAKKLAEKGYFIASGGGPGMMEAFNLGAYLAKYEDDAVYKAIEIMRPAPHFNDPGHHELAVSVLARYNSGTDNLAVPTWFYGHEPSNVFGTSIAKYFSNSIREDTLLAIALHGVIFSPGNAGTTQEIFMDAAQNHYGTYNYYSPMVFLGEQRYTKDTLIFPLLQQLAWGKEYRELLYLSDDPTSIATFIATHPPIGIKS